VLFCFLEKSGTEEHLTARPPISPDRTKHASLSDLGLHPASSAVNAADPYHLRIRQAVGYFPFMVVTSAAMTSQTASAFPVSPYPPALASCPPVSQVVVLHGPDATLVTTLEGHVLPLQSWFEVKTCCFLLTSTSAVYADPVFPYVTPSGPPVPRPLYHRLHSPDEDG
jgi:hypothetical protein